MKPLLKPQGETHIKFLGKSKPAIIKELGTCHAMYCEFLHWLFVPTWGVVLSFDRQICCQVGKL